MTDKPSEEPVSNFKVGNKKPPEATQFKKGQSGNPSGRPKGSIGLKQAVEKEMNKIITVSKNGKTIKMKKRDVIAMRTIELSMKGNFPLINMLMRNNDPTSEDLSKASASAEFQKLGKDALQRIAARILDPDED